MKRPKKSRKGNPFPALRDEAIKKAQRLYHDFSGHVGEYEVNRVKVPSFPKTFVAIGECDGILYTTVRDGETEQYIHEFKNSARPLLCCSPDGKQLFLIGGSFEFTERGIVDK